jgi:hypothetical protein
VQAGNDIVLVDQHAADERVRLEAMEHLLLDDHRHVHHTRYTHTHTHTHTHKFGAMQHLLLHRDVDDSRHSDAMPDATEVGGWAALTAGKVVTERGVCLGGGPGGEGAGFLRCSGVKEGSNERGGGRGG